MHAISGQVTRLASCPRIRIQTDPLPLFAMASKAQQKTEHGLSTDALLLHRTSAGDFGPTRTELLEQF